MQKNVVTTDYRSELRLRVIDTAMPIFRQKGVKSVKMDDIASMLGISKRTLYEIYENKEALLLEGIMRNDERVAKELMEYSKTAANEMDILLEFMRIQMKALSDVNPVFFSDIQKYHKITEYQQKRNESYHERSMLFMQSCVKNGYFVPDLNYEILATIGDAFMEHVIMRRLYERFSLQEIVRNFIIFMIRGYCTEKGLKIFDDFLKERQCEAAG